MRHPLPVRPSPVRSVPARPDGRTRARWQAPPLGDDDVKVPFDFGWWLVAFTVGAIGGAYFYTATVHRRSTRV